MIDQIKINKTITSGLEKVTGCKIIKSNTTAKAPNYPYISFTILSTDTKKGTYSGKGTRYIPVQQTWSLTVQSENDNESYDIAMKTKDWLEVAGQLFLSEAGIVVQSVGSIGNRDNLLTMNYEYRKGFDVKFSLMNIIEVQQDEVIENINLNKE